MIQYARPFTISGTLMLAGLEVIINNTFFLHIVNNHSVLTQLTRELQ